MEASCLGVEGVSHWPGILVTFQREVIGVKQFSLVTYIGLARNRGSIEVAGRGKCRVGVAMEVTLCTKYPGLAAY